MDFSDVRGLPLDILDRLILAVRQGRHILIEGPPGAGATMIARRTVGLLPLLTAEERTDLAFLYAAAGVGFARIPVLRPFRAPHHTASLAAMTGSLRNLNPTETQLRERAYRRLHHPFTAPRRVILPGELSLAHGGVLYLDSADEFPLRTLQAVQQARRAGYVRLYRRDTGWVPLPAAPRLIVATMHPNPQWSSACSRETIADVLGDPVRIELPALALTDMARGERWPSTAELRANLAAHR